MGILKKEEKKKPEYLSLFTKHKFLRWTTICSDSSQIFCVCHDMQYVGKLILILHMVKAIVSEYYITKYRGSSTYSIGRCRRNKAKIFCRRVIT